MTALDIRPLGRPDLAVIPPAFAALGWPGKDTEQYERYLREQVSGERSVLVATVDDVFAGYLTIVWAGAYGPFRDLPDGRGITCRGVVVEPGAVQPAVVLRQRRVVEVAAVVVQRDLVAHVEQRHPAPGERHRVQQGVPAAAPGHPPPLPAPPGPRG